MLIENFRKIYLDEAPQHLDASPMAYDILCEQIRGLTAGANARSLPDNVFSISDGNTVYYWIGSADGTVIDIAVSLDIISPGSATVDLSAKNPDLIGGAPFASDLYTTARDDLGRKIRFTSGKILSSDGMKAWRQLFKDKNVISVYDNQANRYQVVKVSSFEELEAYWKDHPDYQRYQYVLSESSGAAFINADFALMEWKRLAGWPV